MKATLQDSVSRQGRKGLALIVGNSTLGVAFPSTEDWAHSQMCKTESGAPESSPKQHSYKLSPEGILLYADSIRVFADSAFTEQNLY